MSRRSIATQVRPFSDTAMRRGIPPGNRNLGQTMFKAFRMPCSEGQQLQLRAAIFNLLNIPHFAAPNSALGTGGFGAITSTSNTNRVIQLALRYSF